MVGKVTVGRVKVPKAGAVNIKIDRTTVLGNPFPMRDESKRREVCEKYAAYFKREVLELHTPINVEFTRILNILRSGQDVNLQCWCAPKQCHGDTIKAWLEFNL